MSQKPHTILVVDDSADQLEMLEFILKDAGYAVLTASSGNKALTILRDKNPDLIVSDVSMPDGDGIELCREIRADERFGTLPILLLSALRKDTASIVEGLEVGADDYLESPFDPAHLTARIARLTRRKRNDDVLLGNASYFRSIIENFSDVITILSEDGIILYKSPSITKLLGYEADVYAGASAFDFIHPDDRAAAMSYFRRAVEQRHEIFLPLEYRMRHADGSWRVMETVGNFIDDPQRGRVAVVNSRDVTERRRIETALRESEAKFRKVLENSRDVIYQLNLETKTYDYMSPAALDVSGYAPEEFLSGGFAFSNALVHPDDLPAIRRHARKLLTDADAGSNIEYRFKTKENGYRWISENRVVKKNEHGTPTAIFVSARDITDRRAVEENVRASEERYRLFVSQSSEAIWRVEIEPPCPTDAPADRQIDWFYEHGYIAECNRIMARMYGFESAAEIVGTPVGKMMPRSEPANIWQLRALIDSNYKLIDSESYELDKDGNTRIFSNNLTGIVENGRVRRIWGTQRDITEQKQSESAIIEANDRAIRQYTSLLQRLAKLGQTVGVARDLNAVFSAILEFTRASAPCSALIVSLYDETRKTRRVVYCWYNGKEMDVSRVETVAVSEGIVGQAIATGEVVINNDYLSAVQKRNVNVAFGFDEDARNPRSSIIAPMQIKGACVGVIEVQSYDPGAYQTEHSTAMSMAGNFIANAIENVRLLELEREREEQFRQSQKLESVGRLAGGIAHDFNNMLTAINGYSSLTLRRLSADDPLRHNIEEIKKAGERSASLTNQLLAFSRQQVLKPRILDVNQTVNDVSFMLKRLIGEDVFLISTLDPDLGQVQVDPGQLSQVIMNLAVNARDAMPTGGTLTIETRNVHLDEEYAARHVPTEAGNYVMMSVSDTGTGIDPETRKHIFEPFFTTKEIGKGTGLGLATVYGIVKQSGGYIWVRSEPERGTTFEIYLPRIDAPAAPAPEPAAPEELPAGSETILLVEDEPMVRNLTVEVLKDCGYNILEAENGVEALEICERGDCRIDLLMTDVVMPRMGGRELAEKIIAACPETRVLFTSGYTDDAVVRHGVIEIGTNFIQKPFSPTALASKVRSVLDSEK